jgi:hypothetical protein
MDGLRRSPLDFIGVIWLLVSIIFSAWIYITSHVAAPPAPVPYGDAGARGHAGAGPAGARGLRSGDGVEDDPMMRYLRRGVIFAGILWALFAHPLLTPSCTWAELSGYLL